MTYKEAFELAQEIDKKLLATDKRFSRSVQLIDEEGTILFYHNAFIEVKDKYIFLFTEHHKFEVFDEESLLYYSQLKRMGVSNLKEN